MSSTDRKSPARGEQARAAFRAKYSDPEALRERMRATARTQHAYAEIGRLVVTAYERWKKQREEGGGGDG